MRHRLDTRGLRRIELAHQVDDLRKAVLVDGNLGFGQRKAGEMRDGVDLVAIEAHRKLKQKMWEMCAESYLLPCGSCCRLLNCRHFFAAWSLLHVQTLAWLLLERSVDRLGNRQYSYLRPRQGHRSQRALGCRGAG